MKTKYYDINSSVSAVSGVVREHRWGIIVHTCSSKTLGVCSQTRQLHKSRRLRSVIADVLYLDEVKAALVLAGCSPDSNVWGGHKGKRERGCRHRFSSSLVCVQAADGGRRGTLLFRGPQNLDPEHPRPKHRGLQAGLHPDCLSRYRRVYWGAGSTLSRMPWRHLPLMPPQ